MLAIPTPINNKSHGCFPVMSRRMQICQRCPALSSLEMNLITSLNTRSGYGGAAQARLVLTRQFSYYFNHFILIELASFVILWVFFFYVFENIF